MGYIWPPQPCMGLVKEKREYRGPVYEESSTCCNHSQITLCLSFSVAEDCYEAKALKNLNSYLFARADLHILPVTLTKPLTTVLGKNRREDDMNILTFQIISLLSCSLIRFVWSSHSKPLIWCGCLFFILVKSEEFQRKNKNTNRIKSCQSSSLVCRSLICD